MAVAKGLNVFNRYSFERISNGCLDGVGAQRLQVVRVNGDLEVPKMAGSRSAYICFNVSPQNHDVNREPNFIWGVNTNLYLNKDNFQDLGADIFLLNAHGVGPWLLWCRQDEAAYWITADGRPNVTLTYRGQEKVSRVVTGAKALKDKGWTVSFGLTNEPNNLGGYRVRYSDPSQIIMNSWWPMKARVYAAFYETIIGYARDVAWNLYGWDLPFAFGETSYYNSCFCDVLEDVGFSDPGVPPIPPNAYPDARYPNLFLYWYITDGRPGWSPGGRRLTADGITYHSYLDDDAAFPGVQYDVMKMDGVNQGLYCFRNPNYYTGRYYGSVPIALTEWGCEGLAGQDAVNFLNNVWHSDTFHNSGLNNALWYCDWCGTAHAKAIFKNINQPTSPGDCALTSLAEPAGCDYDGPPYGVCGTTLRDLRYPP